MDSEATRLSTSKSWGVNLKPSLSKDKTKKLKEIEVNDLKNSLKKTKIGNLAIKLDNGMKVSERMNEFLKRLEYPSTPLMPSAEQSVPKIVKVEASYTVEEGKTACCFMHIEGNPVPSFKFFKGSTELSENRRLTIVTDGNNNNLILFSILKVKTSDEAEYRIVLENSVGSDEATFTLFVAGGNRVDFRSLLSKKNYAKTSEEIKPLENPHETVLKKVEKRVEYWVEPLTDLTVKIGESNKDAILSAKFTSNHFKPRWYFKRDEIFSGQKYKIYQEENGEKFSVAIRNPNSEDAGKYSVEVNGISTSSVLTVIEPESKHEFIKELPESFIGYLSKTAHFVCQTNTCNAKLKWFKNDIQVEHESDERFQVKADLYGNSTFSIKDLVKDDAGNIKCCIDGSQIFTECIFEVKEEPCQFTQTLQDMIQSEQSTFSLECSIDNVDAEVKWFFEDKIISHNIDNLTFTNYEFITDGHKRILKITDCPISASGVFKCTTQTHETSCRLEVVKLNRFIKILDNQTVKEADSAIFECQMADDEDDVQWIVQGTIVQSNSKFEIHKLANGIHRLVINQCTLLDNQTEIICKNLQMVQTNCKLFVLRTESKPCVEIEDQEAENGEVRGKVKVKDQNSSLCIKVFDPNGFELSVRDFEVKFVDDDFILKISNPNFGQSGIYRLVFSNDVGESVKDVRITFVGIPRCPENLSLTDCSNSSCILRWNPPKNDGGKDVIYYIIEQNQVSDEGELWTEIGDTLGNVLFYKIENLEKNLEYRFRIKAQNEVGLSEPAELKDVYITNDHLGIPKPPKMVEVLDWDRNMVELGWNPPDKDECSNISAYQVECKEVGQPFWIKCGLSEEKSCKIRITDVIEIGKTYEFRVRALNEGGCGEPSNATKEVSCKGKSSEPTIIGDPLNNIFIKRRENLVWEIHYSGEPDPDALWLKNDLPLIASERILICTSKGKSTLKILDVDFDDSGFYALQLTNSEGNLVTLGNCTVIGEPQFSNNLLEVEEISSKQAKIRWQEPSYLGGSPIICFEIEKMNMETGRWASCGKVDGKTTTFSVMKLNSGKNYKFRIRAINQHGPSEYLETSDDIETRNAFTIPQPVIDLRTWDWGYDSVRLGWEWPGWDGGRPITQFIVERREKFDLIFSEVMTTRNLEVHLTNLIEGQFYQFRVKAVNEAGIGPPCEPTVFQACKQRQRKPEIQQTKSQIKTIKVGSDISFSFDVIGDPQAIKTWKYNHLNLPQMKDRIEISNESSRSTLTLKKATRKDSGLYELIVENKFGNDVAKIDLDVLGKPERPNGPLEVFDVSEDNCWLKWHPPLDDGGLAIQEYKIESWSSLEGAWTMVGDLSGELRNPTFKVTNLKLNATYKFRVRAQNSGGFSDYLETESKICMDYTFANPDSPSGLSILSYDNSSVHLTWKWPSNVGGSKITSFLIQQRQSNSDVWKNCGFLEDVDEKIQPEFRVVDLKEDSQLYFRVIAFNKSGCSPPSEETSIHTVKHQKLSPKIERSSLPKKSLEFFSGKSIMLKVIVSGEPCLNLSWYFNGEPIENFKDILIENYSKMSILKIENGQRSCSGSYKLEAKNEHGRDEATFSIFCLSLPSSPKGPLVVSKTPGGCKLEWKQPQDDGGKPISGFTIQKMHLGIGNWVTIAWVDPWDNSCIIKGLQYGGKYLYRVLAENEVGKSSPLESEHAFEPTEHLTVPEVPCNVRITYSDENMICLQWEKPRNSDRSLLGNYIIELKTRLPGKYQTESKIFRVIAQNSMGFSTSSQPISFILPPIRESKPRIKKDGLNEEELFFEIGENMKLENIEVAGFPSPQLKWIFNGVDVKAIPNIFTLNESNATSLIVRFAQRENSGTYKLLATNAHGIDELQLKIIFFGPPMPPEGPIKVDHIENGLCKICWKAPLDNGGFPIQSYIIESQIFGQKNWKVTGRTNGSLDTIISGFPIESLVQFRIRAVNSVGESASLQDKSGPVLIRNLYLVPGRPGLPTVLSSTLNSVHLEWSAPIRIDISTLIKTYQIEFREINIKMWKFGSQVNGEILKGTVEGLKPGKKYEFRVIAVNDMGQGKPSESTLPFLIEKKKLPPKIMKSHFGIKIVKLGRPQYMTVDVIGDPVPNIVWFFNNNKLEETESLKISNSPGQSKLIINSFHKNLVGNYRVCAKNSLGEDEAELVLLAKGCPDSPSASLIPIEVIKNAYFLNWIPPIENGESSVEFYNVRRFDEETRNWLLEGIAVTNRFQLKEFDEKNSCLYSISAVNSNGESLPLQMDEEAILKIVRKAENLDSPLSWLM